MKITGTEYRSVIAMAGWEEGLITKAQERIFVCVMEPFYILTLIESLHDYMHLSNLIELYIKKSLPYRKTIFNTPKLKKKSRLCFCLRTLNLLFHCFLFSVVVDNGISGLNYNISRDVFIFIFLTLLSKSEDSYLLLGLENLQRYLFECCLFYSLYSLFM